MAQSNAPYDRANHSRIIAACLSARGSPVDGWPCDARYSLPRIRNSVQNSDLAAKLGISPIDSKTTVERRGFTDGKRVAGGPRMDQ